MQYVPDNYDMFLQHEYEQERLRKQEQEEWEEVYGSPEIEFVEDGNRNFD